jgi:hypothetical protein
MFVLLVEIPSIIALAYYKAFLAVQGKSLREPNGAAIWLFRISGSAVVLGGLILLIAMLTASGAWAELAKTAASLLILATVGVVVWARSSGN